MNQGIKAEEAILQRLENPDLNEIVRRQLTNKLEVIRMQNVVGTEEPDYQSQTGEVPPKQQENPEDGYDEENSGEDSLQETEGKEIEEEIEENTDEQ
jgi:hypothetical protein